MHQGPRLSGIDRTWSPQFYRWGTEQYAIKAGDLMIPCLQPPYSENICVVLLCALVSHVRIRNVHLMCLQCMGTDTWAQSGPYAMHRMSSLQALLLQQSLRGSGSSRMRHLSGPSPRQVPAQPALCQSMQAAKPRRSALDLPQQCGESSPACAEPVWPVPRSAGMQSNSVIKNVFIVTPRAHHCTSACEEHKRGHSRHSLDQGSKASALEGV